MGALKAALLGIGGGVILRQFQQASDALTQVQNRLSLVTRNQAELRAVQEALFQAANDTRSSFEATAEVYARTALSARNLGLTQRETINFTKALNQAIILSGASAQEARNGLIQFSQGLAANRLAGDELRAVLEQLPLVADVIAEELGVTRGALRDLAAQGKITAQDIVDAFGPETQARLESQFAGTTATIAQSLTILENEFVRFAGRLNEGAGVAGILNAAIGLLARNFETFGRVVLAGVVTSAIIGTITALRTLTAIIAANPLGALAVAVTFALSTLIAFSDQIFVTTDGITTLQDVGVGLLQEFGIAFREFLAIVKEVLGTALVALGALSDGSQVTFLDILRGAAVFADRFVGVFVGLGSAVKAAFEDIPATMKALFVGAINAIVEALEFLSDAITSVFFGINRTFSDLGVRVQVALINIGEGLNQLANRNFDEASRFFSEATFQLTTGAKEAVTNLGSNIASEFDRLRETDVLKRIEGPLVDDAAETGKKIGEAFLTGFESTTGVQGLVDRAIVRAQGRSADRELARLRNEGAADLNATVAGDDQDRLGIADINLQKQIDELTRRNAVLREGLGLTAEERQVKEELLKIEEELLRKGIELTDAQRLQIQTTLEENLALEAQTAILESLNGAAESARFQMAQLQTLFETGRVSVEQYREELRRLRVQELEQSRDVTDGFERGFLKLQDTIGDFAAQSEATITNAFNGAEDALVEFVTTGEVNFSKLVDSILADLTRLLARQALFGLLGAVTGGQSGFSGSLGSFLFGGAREDGGEVTRGRSYLVGERGPELFVPDQSGTIIPNGQGIEPPQVNVNITNVTDPNEVVSALTTTEGERAILNIIRRNPRALREIG